MKPAPSSPSVFTRLSGSAAGRRAPLPSACMEVNRLRIMFGAWGPAQQRGEIARLDGEAGIDRPAVSPS
jgi:hypothetical protein